MGETVGETVGETMGPGIVDSMLLYNAHPDYTKCNNITIDAQTNMAFYPINRKPAQTPRFNAQKSGHIL